MILISRFCTAAILLVIIGFIWACSDSPAEKDSSLLLKSSETIVPYNPDEFVPVDAMPELVDEAIPVYPEKALESDAEGIVWVRAYVDGQGIVGKAEIVKCDRPGYGFEKAALEAAYKNKFKPAMRDGQPVVLWITYSVNFVLGSKCE